MLSRHNVLGFNLMDTIVKLIIKLSSYSCCKDGAMISRSCLCLFLIEQNVVDPMSFVLAIVAPFSVLTCKQLVLSVARRAMRPALAGQHFSKSYEFQLILFLTH